MSLPVHGRDLGSGLGKTPQRHPAKNARRPRTDRITTGWMIAGVVCGIATILFRGVVPQAWWTAIHVVTLGILTNGILQWSWYFSRSLLRLPPDSRAAGLDQVIRQLAFNVSLVMLVAGMWLASLPVVIISATGIGAVLAWHTVALLLALRTKLGSRFAVVIRYYVVAGASLVVGCALAGLIATTMFARSIPLWLVNARADLTLAHALINFLGWIGLSIAGTLVTLGPTILRVRLEPDAVDKAVSALPAIIFALLGMTIGAAFGYPIGVGIFLMIYLAALVWAVGLPLFASARRRADRPLEYAGKSLLTGIAATALGLMAMVVVLLVGSHQIPAGVIGFIGAGGVLTIFIGALSYLMPVVIGGGPSAVKEGIAALEVIGVFRLTLRYCGLVLAVLEIGPRIMGVSPWWLLVIATYAADIAILAVAGIRQSRSKRRREKDRSDG